MVLRGRWCNIIVLNVHAPTEEKSDDSKDRFYEELEQIFYNFLKYRIKILLGDFNAKLGREDTFKPTIENECLHEDSNDNGVRVENFATSKNLVVKSMMFWHQNIHKYTWTSPDGKTHYQVDHVLIGDSIQVYSMCDLSGELTVILITVWWLQKLGKDWR
jgi:exonuclease III